MKKVVLSFVLIPFFFFGNVVPVSAQQAASPVIESTDPQQVQQQMNTLKDLYRQQLDQYRSDEHDYIINRDQYFQLQTLTSLEDSVKATRKVMVTRDEVLQTYIQLVKLILIQTRGIDVSVKKQQLDTLDQVLQDLKKHQAQLEVTTDRSGLSQRVADFAWIGSEVENVPQTVFLLVSYGKVQALYDKTVVVKNEVKNYVEQNEKDALRLSEKRRGFTEIDQTLDAAGVELKSTFADITTPQKYGSQNGKTSDNLYAAYGGISRTMSYLKEISNL
jgi:hypothetical protein